MQPYQEQFDRLLLHFMFFALLYSVGFLIILLCYLHSPVVNFKDKVLQGTYIYLAIFGMKIERKTLQTTKYVS